MRGYWQGGNFKANRHWQDGGGTAAPFYVVQTFPLKGQDVPSYFDVSGHFFKWTTAARDAKQIIIPPGKHSLDFGFFKGDAEATIDYSKCHFWIEIGEKQEDYKTQAYRLGTNWAYPYAVEAGKEIETVLYNRQGGENLAATLRRGKNYPYFRISANFPLPVVDIQVYFLVYVTVLNTKNNASVWVSNYKMNIDYPD